MAQRLDQTYEAGITGGSPAGVAVKCISWAAVFAGVILALVVQLLLNMLGTGIGMSTIDPAQGDSPSPGAFGISAGIWWAVSSLVALFIGGWIAGHLAGMPRKNDGIIHGLLVWGLSTLLFVYLLASAVGSVVGGAFSAAGNILSAAGQGVAAVAPEVADAASDELSETDISWNRIKQEARTLLRQTGKPALQPEALEQQSEQAADTATQTAQQSARQPLASDEEFESALDRLIRQAQGTASEADREAVINVLVARGMDREEAIQTVNNWQNAYQQAQARAEQLKQQAEAKARQLADRTAETVAKASLWGFFALLLGALASAFGGAFGRPRNALA